VPGVLLAVKRLRRSPTTATRSAPFIRHRRRSHRSPGNVTSLSLRAANGGVAIYALFACLSCFHDTPCQGVNLLAFLSTFHEHLQTKNRELPMEVPCFSNFIFNFPDVLKKTLSFFYLAGSAG